MRALTVILIFTAASFAAFQGTQPQRKITSTAASASDTIKATGGQVILTVTGASATTGAFVTISSTFPCTAKRDTSDAANASFFVLKGVPVVRARPVGTNGLPGVQCIAMTTADSGNSAVLRYEAGYGAP